MNSQLVRGGNVGINWIWSVIVFGIKDYYLSYCSSLLMHWLEEKKIKQQCSCTTFGVQQAKKGKLYEFLLSNIMRQTVQLPKSRFFFPLTNCWIWTDITIWQTLLWILLFGCHYVSHLILIFTSKCIIFCPPASWTDVNCWWNCTNYRHFIRQRQCPSCTVAIKWLCTNLISDLADFSSSHEFLHNKHSSYL